MDLPQSIYFFTLHKCASTLFAKHVLKNLDGLQGVDYAAQLFNSARPLRFEFRPSGHAYGPLRVSLSEDAVVYRQLVERCLQPEFLADKKAICHVRDPRDILISHYHSAGWTHPISRNPEIAEKQLAARRMVQAVSVDEYAIQQAPALRTYFERISGVLAHAHDGVWLRYKDRLAPHTRHVLADVLGNCLEWFGYFDLHGR